MNHEMTSLGYFPTFNNEPDGTVMFTIDGEPMSKQRPRFNPKSGRAYTPAQTRNVEREIAETYLSGGHKVFDGSIGVELTFFMGTKRRKDIDNLVKTVLDALNGVAFTDDHLVHVLSAVKFFSTPDKARTVVKIYRIDSTTLERN